MLLLTEEVFVPWELASIDDLQTPWGGSSPFLGAHVAVSRWPLKETRPRPTPRARVTVSGGAVVVADYAGVAGFGVLTEALDGLPGVAAVRGSSMTGLGYVDVVVASAADLPRTRAELGRRMDAVRPRLPPNVHLQLGPEASSTGWVLEYALVAPAARGLGLGAVLVDNSEHRRRVIDRWAGILSDGIVRND